MDIQNWAGACDLVADARYLPFSDRSVDAILNHALLEHIAPWDTMRTLREWYRVLIPGGIVQIEVPDLRRIFEDWLVKGRLGEQEAINNIFGGVCANKPYSHQYHLTGFTYARLTRRLEAAGYTGMFRLEHPRYHHILIVQARRRG